MSNTASILKKAEPAYTSRAPEYTPGFFLGVCNTYAICISFRIVLSNTYCVVFFSLSCVLYVAGFSRLSFFDCPFGIR